MHAHALDTAQWQHTLRCAKQETHALQHELTQLRNTLATVQARATHQHQDGAGEAFASLTAAHEQMRLDVLAHDRRVRTLSLQVTQLRARETSLLEDLAQARAAHTTAHGGGGGSSARSSSSRRERLSSPLSSGSSEGGRYGQAYDAGVCVCDVGRCVMSACGVACAYGPVDVDIPHAPPPSRHMLCTLLLLSVCLSFSLSLSLSFLLLL